MIPKSTAYKLVENEIIIAAGSKHDMLILQRQHPGTNVILCSHLVVGQSIRNSELDNANRFTTQLDMFDPVQVGMDLRNDKTETITCKTRITGGL